jgi:hypothetical protein
MSLADAVLKAGIPPTDAAQSEKKRYSELLSKYLAPEIAAGLRNAGFENVKPLPGGPGEKAFQGGLGSKKVDVAYSDEQHGLLLAISIKTICFPPFGKNLKNRFGDICTEAITLHMRFPYSVVGALFAFPAAANEDVTKGRKVSTFRRAGRLLGTISGRQEYTDPGEKFETVTLMLFNPLREGQTDKPALKLYDAKTFQEISEADYFARLKEIFNNRNPHCPVGDEMLSDLDESEES